MIAAMADRRPLPPRPYDDIVANGPPTNPPDFDQPIILRGRREDFLVFCDRSNQHIEAKNCLFRDPSRRLRRNGGGRDSALGSVSEAYWPIPNKQPMRTIMGHVEFCYVITRASDDDDDDSCSDSDSDDDSYREDDDIVFSLTQRMVAVKVNYGRRMEQHKGRHAENPLQELSCMQLLGNENPHVMGVIDALFVGGNLNVVMPYARDGDLFEMLQQMEQTGNRSTEDEARFWFRQLVEGVRHLHESGVCHRDLSPENVMIDAKNCLIIDMGMALRIPYTDPRNPGGRTHVQNGGRDRRLMRPQGTAGKLPYMSPEIYENRVPFDGPATDVWTMGTILFCMVTGNRSYGRPDEGDPQFYWMSRALGRLLVDWEIHLSNDLVDLLTKMITVDPRLRATLDEVRNHPWVRAGGGDIAVDGFDAMAIDAE